MRAAMPRFHLSPTSTSLSFLLFSLFIVSFFPLSTFARAPIRSDKVLKTNIRAWEDDFLKENETCQRRGDYGYPRCAPGLWCLGKDKLTCQKRSDWNGRCDDDPYRCGEQLKCENGVCVDELLPYPQTLYIEGGRPCDNNAYQRCRPGLWCVAGACRKLVRCGGICDEVRFLCRPGLVCHYIAGKDYRFCRPVAGTHPVKHGGEKCEIGRTPCITGFRCVVRKGVGTCRRPTRIGRPCGDNESDCEHGRECKVMDGVRKCVQIMKEGNTCGKKYSLYCASGLSCSCKAGDRCVTGQCMKN